MPIYKNKATHMPTRCFVSLSQDIQSPMEYVRSTGKTLSVLDQDGKIIEETTPNSKILPTDLSNQQICERSLSDGIQQLTKGMNMSIFYIGATFSGKEKLADGNKQELPLSQYFIDKIMNYIKRKGRQVQYRLKMLAIINQRVYDCFAENKNSTLKLKQDIWQGVESSMCKTIPIQSPHDFGIELGKAIKQKNKLVLELKDMYCSYLTLEIIQKNPQDPKQNIVSHLNVVQIPGVECLTSAHGLIKIKQSSSSTRSLIGFSNLVTEMSKFPDCIIHYQSSQLTYLLKEIIGGNSLLYSFLTLKVSDIDGTMSTLKFLKPLQNLQQYPFINDSLGYGMVKKFRAWAQQNNANKNGLLDEEKKLLEQEMMRLQTEEDYKKLLEKYAQLKQKYALALKAKSESQLQLIKCQQQKLQLGKALVEVQIENTKLLEKLQNKDYQNGKRVLNAQNLLAQKQMSYQECLDKINQLNAALNEALQSKRDLEVEFIALKRNYILQQKQLKQLKEDNQNLGLDVINLAKQNQRLKKNLMEGQDFGKSRLILQMENQKYDELKRINKEQQNTISYLKAQIQRYKKQVIELQMAANGMFPRDGDEFGKDYRRIQLENQNMELLNRHRLNLRKIQELQEKVGYYGEQNENLEEENRQLKLKDHQQTQQYRQKMERFTKNTNSEAVVKELKENFSRKDIENLDKINSLKRDLSQKKREIINLKSYVRELIALLEEWGPKGIDIPVFKKYENIDLTGEKGAEAFEELRIKNLRLEEQLRRMKGISGSRVKDFKESRVVQEYDFLKNSGSKGDIEKLKREKNELGQENRRLMTLLKDGRKMDINIIQKENESLKRELEAVKNSSSISPSTSDQKLKFYEKHIKLLQKQRSELLSRCVVAEEQLKNLLQKVGKSK